MSKGKRVNDSDPNTVKNNSDAAEKESSTFKPLRIWPLILLLIAVAAAKFLPSLAENDSMALIVTAVFGPVIFSILILVWWLAFSRATFKERLVGFFGVLITGALVVALSDKTMMGPGVILIGVPLGTAAFGIALLLLSRVLSFKRTVIAILAATCGIGFIATLRNDGMWGNGQLGLNWRWEESPEDKMLATREAMPKESLSDLSTDEIDTWLADSPWPQFRGHLADGKSYGPAISSDWPESGLKQIWKVPVGPGWSSFAVAGKLLYTQEQHGELESVVCYSADNGNEIWKQQISERFLDTLGGPGPRATPTLAGGKLFAQGATGTIQRLNPKTGEVAWTNDIKKVADREPPVWGFSSSPVVFGSNVIVYAGGKDDKGLLAFDTESGQLSWSAACGEQSYSTPQLCKLHGQDCLLMLTNLGLTVLDPGSGKQLLDYEWNFAEYRAVQPQIVDGHSILLPTQEVGTRRILIENGEQFSAKEEWTAEEFRPDFNDFVVFENHAYGFDGRIFACLDLKTGERKWRGGRYGKGQVLLLVESGLLLIVSESGELVLVKATSESHQEITKFKALQGRTWNHPVVIGNLLYVRNSQEAACFELPLR